MLTNKEGHTMKLTSFRCSDCKFVFERWSTNEETSAGVPCELCNKPAPQHFAKVNFSFKGGSPSENSFDMLIGREAEKRWSDIEAQKAERNKMRKDSNESFLVSVGDGQYRPSTPEEKENTRNALNAYEKTISKAED